VRVLISHDSRNDGEFALKLANMLRSPGVEPRIENLKAVCGDDVQKLLRELRTRYNYVITVLSPSYKQDDFLTMELFAAMMIEQMGKTKYVIPAVVAEFDISPLLRPHLIDFREVAFEEGSGRINNHISEARQVFVVMKYGDPELDSAYSLAIKPVLERFNFSVIRVSEVQDAGSITDEIFAQIDSSSVVLADLTGERPNCYLEVGYALALEKQLILTAREGAVVHFDIAGRRIIQWKTADALEKALALRLQAMKEPQGPDGGAHAATA
jgi:hypothetical protein